MIGTPAYLSEISNTKILNFRDFYCPNVLRWILLLKRMYRLPKNLLQHTPPSFRYTKSRVLDFGGTHSYLYFKSTYQNHKISVFNLLHLVPDFSSVNMKLQQLKFMLPPFQKTFLELKYRKNIKKKLRALRRICLKLAL